MISIKYRITLGILAIKYSDVQIHWLAVATHRAQRRAGLKAVYRHDDSAHLHRDVLLDLQELGKPQVTHLSPPHPLHSPEVQILKAQDVILACQSPRQLEVNVSPLVGQSSMGARQPPSGLLIVVAPWLLARQGPIQACDLLQILLEVLRHDVRFALVVGQEDSEPKIKAADSTCAGYVWNLYFLHDREADVQSSHSISLDCDRFDLTLNLSALGELVGVLADTHPVLTQVFPPRLFQREAAVLFDPLEAGTTSLEGRLSSLVLEECLIAPVQTVRDVLHRLATYHLPVCVPFSSHSQLGQVCHQLILVDVATGEPVVATLQGHAVVPDDAGDIYLAMQVLVALVVVQAVLECLADRDHRQRTAPTLQRNHYSHCSSYVLIRQVETQHKAPYIPNLKGLGFTGLSCKQACVSLIFT